ncbi:MAG: hypothetical protein R3C05_02305 [Pirellulaceae bacterium]
MELAVLICSGSATPARNCRSVVLLAPKGSAVDAATNLLQLRMKFKESNSDSVALLRSADVQWPRLASPGEIGQMISDQWNIVVSAASLPHDLWAEKNLRDIDAATAIVLLGSGFSNRGFMSRPKGESTTSRQIRPLKWQSIIPPLKLPLR